MAAFLLCEGTTYNEAILLQKYHLRCVSRSSTRPLDKAIN